MEQDERAPVEFVEDVARDVLGAVGSGDDDEIVAADVADEIVAPPSELTASVMMSPRKRIASSPFWYP